MLRTTADSDCGGDCDGEESPVMAHGEGEVAGRWGLGTAGLWHCGTGENRADKRPGGWRGRRGMVKLEVGSGKWHNLK